MIFRKEQKRYNGKYKPYTEIFHLETQTGKTSIYYIDTLVLHCLKYNIHIGASGIQKPNSLTGNRKPSAKTMCRKPPNIMWSRKYVGPKPAKICRIEKKNLGALPPNPRTGAPPPLLPPCALDAGTQTLLLVQRI